MKLVQIKTLFAKAIAILKDRSGSMDMSPMETSEGDAVWIVVTQLIESFVLEILQRTAQKWFDEIRDF